MITGLYRNLQQWRPLLFVGCNVIILALGIFILMPVYDMLADRNSEIRDKRELLTRLQSVIARESEVQAAMRQPESQTDQGEFLIGTNEGVIGADLQTRLKAIAERSGAQIRTMQGQPSKPAEQMRYIGARLTISGNLQRIHNTIYQIEASKPYMFITSAAIKLEAPAVRGGAAIEPVIEARLDVFGATLTSEQRP